MEMLKKFGVLLLSAMVSNYAYAGIIELDAMNPDHCRQQILTSESLMPIIALYSSDSRNGSDAFMKNYETLAAEHPDLAFYKWDMKKDTLGLTRSLCMQQVGVPVVPSMMMVGVMHDDEYGSFMTQPYRSTFTMMLTLRDLEEFIGVSDTAVKQFMHAQRKNLR